MSLQADILVDRRRLTRRLGLWRLLAVLFAIGFVVAIALRYEAVTAAMGVQPHIARVTISGMIQDDRRQYEMLERIGESDRVAGVILQINSPGGTTTGGEGLNRAIQRLAESKPVVSVMGTIATSAAYIAALASDHLVARGNSVTGSVGVVFQWAEVSDLLDSLGIRVEEIKSGPLKATPSPFQPIDEAGRRVAEQLVSDAQQWFVALVAEARSLDPAAVPGLTQGRVYSGRQALDYKLIDAIGDEKTAVGWLEDVRDVPEDLRIVDWQPSGDGSIGIWSAAAQWLAPAVGNLMGPLIGALTAGGIGAGQLDGLVSLWHPHKD